MNAAALNGKEIVGKCGKNDKLFLVLLSSWKKRDRKRQKEERRDRRAIERKKRRRKKFSLKKKTKKFIEKKNWHAFTTLGHPEGSASVQKSCFCLMPSSDEENWKKNKFRQRTVDSGGSGSNEKIGLKRRNVPQQTDEVKMKKIWSENNLEDEK